MRSPHRRGYTWIELVVCIGVILFLLALLLPAVRQSRIPGSRNTCSNNMRNLALSVMMYAGANGAYPGYLNSLATVPGEARVTWIVSVLPYLERTDIYNAYRNPGLARAGGVDPRMIYMDVLV